MVALTPQSVYLGVCRQREKVQLVKPIAASTNQSTTSGHSHPPSLPTAHPALSFSWPLSTPPLPHRSQRPLCLAFDPLRMRLLPSSLSAVRDVTAFECPVKITLQRRVLRSHIRTWLSSPLSNGLRRIELVNRFDGLTD